MLQCEIFQQDDGIVWLATVCKNLFPKFGHHPHMEGHGHCITISQTQTLILSEKQVK